MTSRRNLLMALLFLSAAGISAPLYARDDDWDDDDDDDDDDDRGRRPRRRKDRD